jgi:hypothetical protein
LPFFAICYSLFLVHAFGCGSFAQSGCEPFLVDCFHAGSGYLQGNPATLLLGPEALGFQIGTEFALGLVVRVRDVISHDRHLACDFANFHCLIIFG